MDRAPWFALIRSSAVSAGERHKDARVHYRAPGQAGQAGQNKSAARDYPAALESAESC